MAEAPPLSHTQPQQAQYPPSSTAPMPSSSTSNPPPASPSAPAHLASSTGTGAAPGSPFLNHLMGASHPKVGTPVSSLRHSDTAPGEAEGEDDKGKVDQKAPGELDTNNFNPYFLAATAAYQQGSQNQQPGPTADANGQPPPAQEQSSAVQPADGATVYKDYHAPFPLPLGVRTVSGMAASSAASMIDPALSGEGTDAAPAESSSPSVKTETKTEANTAEQNGVKSEKGEQSTSAAKPEVGLGKTRCYWAILAAPPPSADVKPGELRFLYFDPVLQAHMGSEAQKMVGTSFFDYVHPDEKERACDDMRKIVDSRTLFGSVTRCRYSRVPRIRHLLGCENPPTDADAHKYVVDESFLAIDIVINWIGDGMALCFFHAVIDKAPEDNDENAKTDWTNWCGTPEGLFDSQQCEMVWRQVCDSKNGADRAQAPEHVFQILQAGNNGDILFSWPPPRMFSPDAAQDSIDKSAATTYEDGSYFADDFAKLAQGVSIAPGSSSLSDANTSCTRRFRAKHTLTTEGLLRSVESVLIPYGSVVLACFHTTYQQPMPRNLPSAQTKPQEEDRVSGNGRGRQRKSTSGEGHDANGSNKRAKDMNWTSSQDAAQNLIFHSQQQQQQLGGAHSWSNAPAGFDASALDPALGSLNSLANASLGYTSVPGMMGTGMDDGAYDAQGRDRQGSRNPSASNMPSFGSMPRGDGMHGGSSRGQNRHSPPLGQSGLGGSNDPGGSVATLAAVAAAAAAQTKSCTSCGTSNSPEWRRGPTGHKTLCNACGLRYSRSLARKTKKKGKEEEGAAGAQGTDPSMGPPGASGTSGASGGSGSAGTPVRRTPTNQKHRYDPIATAYRQDHPAAQPYGTYPGASSGGAPQHPAYAQASSAPYMYAPSAGYDMSVQSGGGAAGQASATQHYAGTQALLPPGHYDQNAAPYAHASSYAAYGHSPPPPPPPHGNGQSYTHQTAGQGQAQAQGQAQGQAGSQAQSQAPFTNPPPPPSAGYEPPPSAQ